MFEMQLLLIGGLTLFFLAVNFVALKMFKRIGTTAKQQDLSTRWSNVAKPTVGGIVFYLAFILAFIVKEFPYFDFEFSDLFVFIGGTIAFATGLIDDVKRLSPWPKMLGQILAASCVAIFLPVSFSETSSVDTFLKVFVMVGIMNAINMFDNMDGVATLALVSFMLILFHISAPAFPMVFFSAGLAFLFFNAPSAKMYMGDSGSLLLGFVISTTLLSSDTVPNWWMGLNWSPWFLLFCSLGICLVDAIVVSINRIAHRRSPMQGGRDHTTHNLGYLGLSDKKVFLVFVGLAILQFLVFVVGFDPLLSSVSSSHSIIYFFTLLTIQFGISWRNLAKGKYHY